MSTLTFIHNFVTFICLEAVFPKIESFQIMVCYRPDVLCPNSYWFHPSYVIKSLSSCFWDSRELPQRGIPPMGIPLKEPLTCLKKQMLSNIMIFLIRKRFEITAIPSILSRICVLPATFFLKKRLFVFVTWFIHQIPKKIYSNYHNHPKILKYIIP